MLFSLRLALVLIAVCLLVSLGAQEVLYHQRVNSIRQALRITAKNQVALINAIAADEAIQAESIQDRNLKEERRKKFVEKIVCSQENLNGFGQTGITALAKLTGDTIVFEYPPNADSGDKIKVALNSRLALPMQQALLGKSGDIIAKDYRGVEVIAAYEPIPSLGMGLVNKVDLSEVRAQYFSLFGLILAFCSFSAMIGVYFFIRTTRKLVARLHTHHKELHAEAGRKAQLGKALEYSRQMYRDVVENINDIIIALDPQRRITFVSPSIVHTLGYQPQSINGTLFDEIVIPDDLPKVKQVLATAYNRHNSIIEFRSRNISGDLCWLRVSFSPVSDGQRVTGIRGVMSDISERKRVETDLLASQKMLQTVIDQLPGSIFWKDRNSVYLGCNTAFALALGRMSTQEVIGKSDHDLLTDKKLADAYRDIDCRIINSGQAEYHVVEFGVQAGDREVWVDISRVPLHDESGNVVGLLALYYDVTDKFASETALVESESRYRTLFEKAGDYAFLFDINADSLFEVIDVNQAALNVFGYSREEIIGKSITIIDPDTNTQASTENEMLTAAESGTVLPVNRKRKDGSTFVAETTCSRVKIGDKEVILAVERDITKRMQAVDRLSQLNHTLLNFGTDPQENINLLTALAGELLGATCALYNTLEDGMLCSIGLWGTPADFKAIDFPEGHICYDVIMQASEDIFLVRDLKQSKYFETDPHVSQYHLETYCGKAVFASGKAVGSLCVVFQGDYIPTAEDKEVLGIIASAVGSEEVRRYQDKALKESNELYQLAIQGTDAAIWDWYVQTGKAVFNERWASITGYTLKDLAPVSIQTWIDLCHPDDLAISQSMLEKHFRGEIPQYECEARMRHKDGYWIWVLDKGQVTEWDEQGKPMRMTGTHTDISRRKLAEEALRESEEKFRGIAEQLNDAIYLSDDKGVITYISPASMRLFGLSPDTMIGKSFSEFLAPFEIENAFNAFQRCMLNRTNVTGMLIMMKRADGSLFSGELDSSQILRDGNVAGALGVIRDVSARVRSETALRNSERLLSESQCAAGIGSYEFDLIRNIWTNSAAMNEVMGIDEGYQRTFEGWLAIIHPDHRNRLAEYLQRDIIVDHGRFDKEYKIVRPSDGEIRWVHGLGKLEFDAEGKPVRMLGTIQDITDRKQAQEALHYREAEYRHLIENSGEGICVADINEFFTFANTVAEEIFGVSHGELTGKCLLDFLSESEKYRVQNESYNRSNGINSTYELTIVRPDGTTRNLLVTASPKFDATGIFCGSFGIFRDMTDLKRAEEEKQKLESQLRQAQKLETIGTLAGGVAHDFNNILTPILGYADMTLLQMSGDHPTRSNIENIANAALRAKDLVKQILTFSRQSEQERRPMLIQLVIKEALKLLRASIPTTIAINEAIDIEAPAVDCDPTQIHQVFMNLCTNAFHALRDKGDTLSIVLETCVVDEESSALIINTNPGKYVRLSIIDNGHGMDAATIERIFEPFFTTKKPGEGTGLGLSVVHGIIKSHGGTISVESELGKGTTFRVYLPCTEVISKVETPQPVTSLSGSGRILLVDDEPNIVKMTKTMLEHMGYKVTARTNALEALGAFLNDPTKFDVVITDQTMPQMTGTELGKEILQIRPNIPIILITGFSETVTQKNYKHYGFRELVMKPLLARELNAALQRCLSTATL